MDWIQSWIRCSICVKGLDNGRSMWIVCRFRTFVFLYHLMLVVTLLCDLALNFYGHAHILHGSNYARLQITSSPYSKYSSCLVSISSTIYSQSLSTMPVPIHILNFVQICFENSHLKCKCLWDSAPFLHWTHHIITTPFTHSVMSEQCSTTYMLLIFTMKQINKLHFRPDHWV